MQDGWLDHASPDLWLEAMDADGEHAGYILRRDAELMHLPIRMIEAPQRYLEDPWVRYHAQLAHRRGLFTHGQDLNDVQIVLMGSELVKERELAANLRERTFEERLMAGNPDVYRAYKERKEQLEQHEADFVGVEERVPSSVEEFLEALSAFSAEDDGEGTKERGDTGWLSSLLSDEDLDSMSGE